MIFGGPISNEGWGLFLAIGALVVIGGLVSLGLLAGAVAGRARGGVLGVIVFVTAFWYGRSVEGWAGETFFAVACVLALVTAVLLREPGRSAEQPPPRWVRAVPNLAIVAVLVGVPLAIVTGRRSIDLDRRAEVTADAAAQVAETLGAAGPDTHDALDLALLVTGAGGPPLDRADGDRDDGGATLVLQLEDRAGLVVTKTCWRFEVDATNPVDATPVHCPKGLPEPVPGNLSDRLYQSIGALPLPQQTRAASVDRAMAEAVPATLGPDATWEVSQRSEDEVGIAIRIDAVRCILATVKPSELGGTSFEVTGAPADALRTDGVGCRATLGD